MANKGNKKSSDMVTPATKGEKPATGLKRANTAKISEHQLQASFFTWFRAQYPKRYWQCFAIPNGGLRNKVVAAKLKREGAVSGCWDVFLSVPSSPYLGMWIEFKVGYNKLTDNQIAFKFGQTGLYRFEVFYTLEDAVRVVTNYLNDYETT